MDWASHSSLTSCRFTCVSHLLIFFQKPRCWPASWRRIMYGFPKEKYDTKSDLGIMRLSVYKQERDLSLTFYLQSELKLKELIFEWSDIVYNLCFSKWQRRKTWRVVGRGEGQALQTDQKLQMTEYRTKGWKLVLFHFILLCFQSYRTWV